MKAPSTAIEGKTSSFTWEHGTTGKMMEKQLHAYALWAETELPPVPATSSLVKPGCRPALQLRPRPADQPKALPSAPAPATPSQIQLQWLESGSYQNTPLPWSGDAPF